MSLVFVTQLYTKKETNIGRLTVVKYTQFQNLLCYFAELIL